MKRFSLRLEKDLHEKLRTESFKTERSINEIVVGLIKNNYKEEKEMEEFNLKKESLMKKINGLIDEEILNTGKMGTEEITVSLNLTDEEKEIFYDIEEYENENYWWEFIDGNNLRISYVEDIE